MANRYLVAGGSGLWNATDTNNWSATSGGASGASCPTSSDDVFLDAGSAGASIGCQATATAANVDCTGFTGTFSWGGAVSTTWGGSWTFSAGMTVNGVAFSTQVFTGTGTHTITSAGKQFGNFTINSSGGSYTLQDALTVGASGTATLTFTRGTLDTNGNTVAAGGFSSNNSNTRTLTLGASALNMSTTAPWNVGTTNLTLTANTSVVTCSASGASFITWQTFNWNGMSLVFTGGSANTAVATNLTFANFTFTGTAINTGVLTLYGNITTTGTLTINGNSTTNRVLIASNTVGTARTITAATVSCSNVDFMDITGAGAASPFTGTSLGNALGNSGITFTTPVTRYGVVAGNWSNTATWSSTSGGGGGSSVPLCHDTVILDASSAAGTYTADMPRMGASVTCTGFTRTLSCTSTSNTIYGDWTLGSGMTFTDNQVLVFAGRSSHTFTMAGKAFGNNINLAAFGGTYTLADTFNGTVFNFLSGTFSASTYDVNIVSLVYSASTITNMGTGNNWNISGAAGTIVSVSAGATVNRQTSRINLTSNGASDKTFGSGGKTYPDTVITTGGAGKWIFTNGPTFNSLTVTGGGTKSIQVTSATTMTLLSNNWLQGASGNVITISAVTGSSAFTLAYSGTISTDYISLQDCTASGGTPFYAGANGVDVSGNTNWTFTAPPGGSTGKNLLLLGVG